MVWTKEKENECHRKYYLKNKEKILKKQYEYYLKNKEKHIAYYYNNKAKYLETNKQYRMKNRERINENERKRKRIDKQTPRGKALSKIYCRNYGFKTRWKMDWGIALRLNLLRKKLKEVN